MDNNKLCGGNCPSCIISKSPEASGVNKVMRLLVTKFGGPAKKIIKEECPVLAARLDVEQQGDCGGLRCPGLEAIVAAELQGDCGVPSRCNDCPVAKHRCGASQQLARLLNRMYAAFGSDAYLIIEGTCPSMTVCPECRIDNFGHSNMCQIERYSFSDFEMAADYVGPKDWRMKAKSCARWQAQEWLVEHGYLSKEEHDADEITEEAVSDLCDRLNFKFDGYGNIVFPE